jgi:hypothetical protein
MCSMNLLLIFNETMDFLVVETIIGDKNAEPSKKNSKNKRFFFLLNF